MGAPRGDARGGSASSQPAIASAVASAVETARPGARHRTRTRPAPTADGDRALSAGRATKTADQGAIGGATQHRRRLRWVSATVVARVVAVGTVVALLVVVAGIGVRLAHDGAVDDARSGALSAARAFALTATSYDYENVDRDYQAVIDRSTGEFREEFVATSAESRGKIIGFHAKSTGRIFDAAVRDVSTDSATVLLVLDQQVVNTSLDAPRIERDRLRLTLVRSGGRWLVSKLESL